jgi:hypothetical protein
MNIPNKVDVSILTQVVFKAFVEVNNKLPEQEDWDSIDSTTKSLWKNAELNYKEICNAIENNKPPFKGDEHAKK